MLGSGSGSTLDPDPDPLFLKGGSQDPDPDPYSRTVDPKIRIRIHILEWWIPRSGSGSGSTPKLYGSATLQSKSSLRKVTTPKCRQKLWYNLRDSYSLIVYLLSFQSIYHKRRHGKYLNSYHLLSLDGFGETGVLAGKGGNGVDSSVLPSSPVSPLPRKRIKSS